MFIDVSIAGRIVADYRAPVDFKHDRLRRHLPLHTQSPLVLWIRWEQFQGQPINADQITDFRRTGQAESWIKELWTG